MDDEMFLQIGAKIVYYRKLRNMSQKELARKIGITRQHLSSIENGKSKWTIDILWDIAKELLISPNDILK